MRIILMMVSLLVISYLVLDGYANGMNENGDTDSQLKTSLEKAEDVNQLIEDVAIQQRQALEKQIQQ
ncbi:MAG: hypothetical protein LJE92_00140 [Gammaproteobacteria bacterium]|nr:hypothetical protein [Gammaproteobacteria bacterium]